MTPAEKQDILQRNEVSCLYMERPVKFFSALLQLHCFLLANLALLFEYEPSCPTGLLKNVTGRSQTLTGRVKM